MSITEPNVAVNAGVATQTDGLQLAPSRTSPPSVSYLVGWSANNSFERNNLPLIHLERNNQLQYIKKVETGTRHSRSNNTENTSAPRSA